MINLNDGQAAAKHGGIREGVGLVSEKKYLTKEPFILISNDTKVRFI